MKKFYFILFFLASYTVSLAQDSVNITFFVATANTTVDAGGIYIAGGGNFGNPGDNQLTDADGSGVYQITIRKPKGLASYYTFTNGACPDYSCKENIAGQPCADPSNFNDRSFPAVSADTVILTCFGECTTDTTCASNPTPAVGPAAPRYAQEDVISLFSDAYTDVTVNTWRTSWSSATFTPTSLAGDSVHFYDNLDFVGIETLDANAIDITGMEHFNVDVWSPNATTFRIKLVDFATSGTTEHEIVFENPAQATWVNYQIDLDSFINLTGRENISQLIFSALPIGGAKIYVDNIFFSKEPVFAEPAAAAADPTDKEENVISIFSNVYDNVTVDTYRTVWSVATLDEVQVDGNDVLKYSDVDFVGIETTGVNSIDATDMDFIYFDAWTPNANTYRIKVVDFGADNAFGGGDDTDHEILIEMAPTETWNSHKIALSDFTNLASTEHISQIVFSALPTGTAILYIDNLYFGKEDVNAVKESIFSTFNVYPNPTTDVINLQIASETGLISSYDIVNVNGQSVASGKVNSSYLSTSVDVSAFPAGVYFVKVNAEQGVYTHRMIIQ